MSEYLENQMSEAEMDNWAQKMSEPLKAFDLSEEELEELKKQGRI